MATTYQDAVRVQNGALAAAEKRLLIRMAHRLPGWVGSDHLTALGALAMVGAGASYWLASIHPVGLPLVVVCLALNWYGDSLDGTVARVRQCQRPRYGFYVDHVLDAVGTVFLVGGMALSGYMSPLVALSLLVAYLLLTNEIYLATSVRRTFRMAVFRFGPTELRIVLAIGTIVLLVHPHASIAGRQYLLFDVGGIVAAVGIVVAFVYSAVRNTWALYREERLPSAPRGPAS